MKKKIGNILPVLLAAVFIASCSAHAKNGELSFSAGDETFTLKKGCIDDVSFKDASSPSVFIKVKKSEVCSQKFDKLISDNIGKNLVVTFNSQALLNAKIASQIKTEDGFNLSVPNKDTAHSIYGFYE